MHGNGEYSIRRNVAQSKECVRQSQMINDLSPSFSSAPSPISRRISFNVCTSSITDYEQIFVNEQRDTKFFIVYREKFVLMCLGMQGHLAVFLRGRHIITVVYTGIFHLDTGPLWKLISKYLQLQHSKLQLFESYPVKYYFSQICFIWGTY